MKEENLYFLIDLTARKIRHYGQAVLEEAGWGLTVEQWLVLKTISENEGINQLGIGELLIKDKPTISRMVKALVTKKLVEKEPSPHDLREVTLHLSVQGKKWFKKHSAVIEEVRLRGLKGLTAIEEKQARSILEKIRYNLTD